jgi:hypothetical protein
MAPRASPVLTDQGIRRDHDDHVEVVHHGDLLSPVPPGEIESALARFLHRLNDETRAGRQLRFAIGTEIRLPACAAISPLLSSAWSGSHYRLGLKEAPQTMHQAGG